ncbi:MAG: hypothetical protein F6J98_42585, partial [Moorea sp. SIO4G2]|nr:hypothetical protein [Moorena sp. SIO4G2]
MTEEAKGPEPENNTGGNDRQTNFRKNGLYVEGDYYDNRKQPRHVPAPPWIELLSKLMGWRDRDQYAAS